MLIDVDLTELFDPRGSGYAYRYDGVFHYFRRSAIDTLRAAVERYRAENTAVMFRILCTNPGQPVVYTYSYNESGVFNYAINASTEEGRRALGAAVTYLVHELLGGDNYSVAGIVLGKNIENSGEYNFMSAGLALDEYAEKYLLALRTVYLAARRDTKTCPGAAVCPKRRAMRWRPGGVPPLPAAALTPAAAVETR